MSKVLSAIRLLGMILMIAAVLSVILVGAGLGLGGRFWAMRMRRWVFRRVIWWLRIRIKVSGVPREGNYLYISNHQSYIDPIAVICQVLVMPVAKAEVAHWPLIGFGARATGILFVKREDKNSRADTRQAIRQALKDGWPILIYPEGTSTDQEKTLPFRPGAFQVAAEEGIGVVPIAIRYGRSADAWIGDDTFIRHFFATFGHWSTDVFLHFGEPIFESDPAILLEKTQNYIDAQLATVQSG